MAERVILPAPFQDTVVLAIASLVTPPFTGKMETVRVYIVLTPVVYWYLPVAESYLSIAHTPEEQIAGCAEEVESKEHLLGEIQLVRLRAEPVSQFEVASLLESRAKRINSIASCARKKATTCSLATDTAENPLYAIDKGPEIASMRIKTATNVSRSVNPFLPEGWLLAWYLLIINSLCHGGLYVETRLLTVFKIHVTGENYRDSRLDSIGAHTAKYIKFHIFNDHLWGGQGY